MLRSLLNSGASDNGGSTWLVHGCISQGATSPCFRSIRKLERFLNLPDNIAGLSRGIPSYE
jgi:hypothetical protein